MNWLMLAVIGLAAPQDDLERRRHAIDEEFERRMHELQAEHQRAIEEFEREARLRHEGRGGSEDLARQVAALREEVAQLRRLVEEIHHALAGRREPARDESEPRIRELAQALERAR